MDQKALDFETRAVHSGVRRRQDFLPTAPSIHPSTTFTYDSVASMHAALDPANSGFAYARNANPTVRELEEAVAALEGTEGAVAFASGMAAFHGAVLGSGIRSGETILAATDLYGVSRTLLTQTLAQLGLCIQLVDFADVERVGNAIRASGARLICFEPISNPLLKVFDVPALIECAHADGALVLIDNTFATPYLCRPADYACDLVLHSATKYLGGHGDVIAGIVACNAELERRVRSVRTVTGGILGPFEAWLVLRGLKTLPLRMRRHCENALAFAQWLNTQEVVVQVYYPGLGSDDSSELPARLFREGLGGGMVAFDTPFDAGTVEAFMDELQLAVPGTSLGDTETLVLSPPLASHRTLTPEERAEAGIGEGLIRVSVGLEAVEDITQDFHRALATVYTPIATP